MVAAMRTRLDLLLICALAIYRGWRFLARDAITERAREALYDRWPPDYKRSLIRSEWNTTMAEVVAHARPAPKRPKVSVIAASIDCPWCAPTFAAVAVTLAVDASFGLTWPVAWFGALCCLVGLLGRADGK